MNTNFDHAYNHERAEKLNQKFFQRYGINLPFHHFKAQVVLMNTYARGHPKHVTEARAMLNLREIAKNRHK